MSTKSFTKNLTIPKTIIHLQLPNGGFPYHKGAKARSDSTAWAVLALSAHDSYRSSCEQGQTYLRAQQDTKGRVCISPQHPEASWPTPLAVLAWHSSSKFRVSEELASRFLLSFKGYHYKQSNKSNRGHDPSILGWPWTADTHGWVIPTGMSILALHVAGQGAHPRVEEGQSMLLDRQLPHGGWNYGNTFVFEKELHPLPECTGIALQALAPNGDLKSVERSIDYLLNQLPRLRTPISLGWTLLGLGAWGLRPSNTEELILASLDLQQRYGPYPIPSLALLFCAMNTMGGLQSLFRFPPSHTTSLPQVKSLA